MKDLKSNKQFELAQDFFTKVPNELFAPKFSANSLEIMQKRHLMRDAAGKILETPKQMFWRVASNIAFEDGKYVKGANARKQKAVEKSAREFYHVMAENRFLPGSRVLFEAGNNIDGTGQLSSCFVLPIEDSLESIFQTMKEAAVVQKNNGGTGFNFSHIRPKKDVVGGTPNVAAGPVHFIKTFSQAFDQILQGKKRGGGNMAILNIDHPDIIEFINLKGKDNSIRNFNISVGITDKFMEAVKKDTEYDLINPRTGKSVKKLRALDVFNLICEKAWECADPGLFFADTVQNANPTKPFGVIEATNPCGEEPLRSFESCNLGSIVLPSHLQKGKNGYTIDWELLSKSIRSAIHFLENMIDLSRFPLQKINQEVELTRKLGLGVVGFGSMLFKMGIAYNSQEGVDLMRKVSKFVEDESVAQSAEMAVERGVFPAYKGSKWDELGIKVRNATMTSIAPTGTLSLVADTSSGIEPIFSLVYKRKSFYQDEGNEERKELLYVDKFFAAYAKEQGFYNEALMERIAENEGSIQKLDGVPEEAKKIFVTTHDISPYWHVAMQAAAQEYVDAAVSKTINMPYEATIDDVKHAYIQAWEAKCKGITMYRDGSKQFQVLETSKKSENKSEQIVIASSNQKKNKKTNNTLTENALQVLEKRALLKDANNQVVETPQELWWRIATHIASKEDEKVMPETIEKFYEIMNNGEFLCGGTIIWAGMGPETIMSKCLVLPIDDSIDDIFKTLNWNIQCLRRGQGTGFNFSKIRSSYSKVKTTGENASGPVEYLKMFNRAQDTIKGRGGREMGAMAILNADHPNIKDFVTAKDDLTAISHYNISVGASNKFMQAVKNNEDWDLIDPHDQKVYKTIKARDLFEDIAKHAWLSGDPGLYFLDHAEKGNTTPSLGTMDATNPCGEQPLIPFETCNMGHINVAKTIKGFPFAEDPQMAKLPVSKKLEFIDWERLATITKIGVRFLDDIIDVNNYPITEIEEMTKKTRNIGLGIMGFADLLVKLGVSYGSEDSLKIAETLMAFIQEKAHQASQELGKEKGNFPAFALSTWYKNGEKNLRNTRATTIAPTGTISLLADCNPGIEPIFALGYRLKNSMGSTDQEHIDPLFTEVAKSRGFYSEALMHKIADGMHLTDIAADFSIPKEIVQVFKTTHEIDPEKHVAIQAAFQKYVDSAVSKTINLSKTATWQDIARVYMQAYDLNCKGITIFRDGSKDSAMQVGTKDKTSDTAIQKAQLTVDPLNIEVPLRNAFEPRKRNQMVRGYTYEVKTEQGALYVTINEDDQGICEVFLILGKSGSYTHGYTEAIGRLISMSLRSGIKAEAIVKQLQGIRTSSPTLNRGMIVYSVPDAIAKIMKKHMDENPKQINLLSENSFNSTHIQEKNNVMNEPVAKVNIVPIVKEIKIPELHTMSESKQSSTIAMQAPKAKTSANSSKPAAAKTEVMTIPVSNTISSNPANKKKYTRENTQGDLLECPECGGDLEYAEGCILCRSCGFSKCG